MYPTFSTLYTEVLNRTRSLPQQSYLSSLKNAVNSIYQEIASWKEWPFFQSTGRINTVAPLTTGTVSGTQGANSLTGIGTAFSISMKGWFIQVGSDLALYEVTAVDPVNQILTFNPQLTATYTGSTFSLFPFSYTLPSDFRMPEPVTAFQLTPKLSFIGSRELMSEMRHVRFDSPRHWSIVYRSSAPQTPQIAFWPFPETVLAMQFLYQSQIPDLVNDSDPVLIPSNYRRAIIEGAMGIFYRDVLDDPQRGQISTGEYIRLRSQMCTDYAFFDDPPSIRVSSFRGFSRGGTDPVVERMVWRV